MNALDLELGLSLREAVRAAMADPGVRVLVLAGDGGNFCTGADLRRDRSIEERAGLSLVEIVQEVVVDLREGAKPSIAAISGNAVGAGLSLALACDFVVAESGAKLSTPFTGVGFVPDGGIVLTLPERVGMGVARDMLLCGTAKDANQALAIGLVDEVCAPGESRTHALTRAQMLSARAPLAITATRRLMAMARSNPKEALAMEAKMQQALLRTEDAQEATLAFRQKRAPQFTGR
jgi:enoyl-CoA hydratase/carnithine racemase